MTDAEPALNVLALNSGSSSLKFGLYAVGPAGTHVLLSGEAESLGGNEGKFHARDSRGGALLSETLPTACPREAIVRIGRLLSDIGASAPAAIGHRIVHGGPSLRQHTLIDSSVLRRLKAAIPFAPLHSPSALAVVHFAKEHFPGLPQAACLDTAFHSDLPDVARVLPIPKELTSEGIQRYGFHGLSCESIVRQLAGGLPDRVVIAHLGNGASVTAVKGGRSIDTSMGLTPTGGVIMGTRSGDLDPGIIAHLIREKKLDVNAVEDLVNRRSGLLGISGVGSDMRGLHEVASSNADARLAIEMFCYSVRKQIGAMIAVLGGVDMVVFTGGIGENDAKVRAAICGELSWFGVSLDEVRNRSATDPISDVMSRCLVRVLPSLEDEQIARHTEKLLRRGLSRGGSAHGAPAKAPATTRSPPDGAIYTCPMHPQIRQVGPGSCPICGMALEPVTVSAQAAPNAELADMSRRLWIGAVLTLPVFALEMGGHIPGLGLHRLVAPGMATWIEFALATPVVLWAGFPVFQRGWASVVNRSLNMFSLIALGTGAAYLYSLFATFVPGIFPAGFLGMGGTVPVYFEAAAVITVLVLLGQVLELRAREQTGGALRALLNLAPKTTRRVKAGGDDEEIALEQVQVGDRLRVRPGDGVPVDGEVVDGASAINESMVTGCRSPRDRATG